MPLFALPLAFSAWALATPALTEITPTAPAAPPVAESACVTACKGTPGADPALCPQICARVEAAAKPPDRDAFWKGGAHPRAIWETVGVSNPRLSPDGKWVAYERKISDWDKARRHTELWLASTDGKADAPWSTGVGNDTAPAWSPAGDRLAFLSTRKGGPAQVWVASTRGGEARVVTDLEQGVDAVAWLDPQRLVIRAEREPTEAEREDEKARRDGILWDHNGRNRRLGVVEATGGQVRWITDGSRDPVDFRVSPDGSRLAVRTAPEADFYDQVMASRVEVVDPTGRFVWGWEGKELAGNLVEDLEWSPDGTRLALAVNDQTLTLVNLLLVVNPSTAETWRLTDPATTTLQDVAWADAKTLLFTALTGTQADVWKVDAKGDKPPARLTTEMAEATELVATSKGYVVRLSRRDQPPDLYAGTWSKQGSLVRLTRANPDMPQKMPIGRVSLVSWKGADGQEIEGVLLLPTQGQAPYPLILWPHGGPDAAATLGWSRWTAFFAANGYAVLEPNFRGSVGYGRDFYAANRGQLGRVDAADCLTGVDAMVQAGVADPNRLLVGGISYGGTLTAGLIGQTSRFKAAVAVAGVTNPLSNYGSSDVNHGLAARWEFLGDPVHDPEKFLTGAALSSLKNATTPTLVMHGQDDERVPLGQSQELYRALVAAGVPTELVIYPREGHGVSSEPAHLEDHLRRWIEWYRAHGG